jgi:DNA relaxase NicK
MATGLFGFKVAYDPITTSKKHGTDYVTFIIPGAACERLGATWLRLMVSECETRKIVINCTRLDYKFDQVEFSPYQFRFMLKNNVTRLVAARSKIKHISDEGLNEQGDQGNLTVYVGSRSSDRTICCYDLHGFTRLEMRNKGERAMLIFMVLARADTFLWTELCKRFLLDYVNFDHQLWLKFINNNVKSYMKLAKKDNPTLEELEKSFILQWSAAFSLLRDIKGDKWQEMIMNLGREKRKNNPGYCSIIHNYGLFQGDLDLEKQSNLSRVFEND